MCWWRGYGYVCVWVGVVGGGGVLKERTKHRETQKERDRQTELENFIFLGL